MQISMGGKYLFCGAVGFGIAGIYSIYLSQLYLWRMIPVAILAIVALWLATRPVKIEKEKRVKQK
jgi:hypothetical protein